jgi:phosphoserine phosphatase
VNEDQFEVLENPEANNVLITDFEGTLGEFGGDYQNGWDYIHQIYGVPDWDLYKKHIDENGDLYHGKHAREDALLIQRATREDAVALGVEVGESGLDDTEWFTEELVEKAKSNYSPGEKTDQQYFESIVEQLVSDFEFYDGADHFLERPDTQDMNAVILSALPVRITERILNEESIDQPVYPWKTMVFGQEGNFDDIEVSHSQGKHQITDEFLKSGKNVFYVGDGANDIAAMKRATTGVFIGQNDDLPTRVHQAQDLQLADDMKPDEETYLDIETKIDEFLPDPNGESTA